MAEIREEPEELESVLAGETRPSKWAVCDACDRNDTIVSIGQALIACF